MNNLSIKFISVEIQNFRGVPDVLRIPLSAPLTIIHAANGTGKSTICYALEWLLTNKVGDLPTTTDFSCQWGSGDTSVSAVCEINGEIYQLERANGKAAIKKHDDRRKRQIRDAALLEMLTPASVSGSSTQATTKARRDWLRNCRWLYANSLALLVDNSESALRQQIFADILGLGHLASTLSNLKEYRTELPKTQGLETKLQALVTEIEALEARLSESRHERDQVALKLNEVLAGFPDTQSTGNLLHDFKTVQLKVAGLLQTAKRQKTVLNLLQEGWAEYESGLQQLGINRDLLKEITETIAKLNNEHSQLAEKLSALNAQMGQAKINVDWARKNTEILDRWDTIIADPVFVQRFPQPDISFELLQQNFVEYGWDADRQQRWLNALEYLISQKSTLLDLLQRKEDLLRNPVLPPANFVQTSKSADEAKQARIKAQAEFDALSSVIDRLRALGHEAMKALTSGHCPLCSHDWKSADALHEHLTYAAATPELQAAKSNLETAQATEQLWSSSLQTANLQQSSAENYSAQLKSVADKLKSIDEKTSYLATMNKAEFSASDVNSFEYLLTSIRIALDAKKIAEAMPRIDEFFQLPSSVNARDGVPAARKALIHYTQHFEQQLKSDGAEQPALTRSVAEKLQSIQAKTQESHQVNASIAAVSEIVNRFQSQWNEVNSGLPVSVELHTATQTRVEGELARAEGYELNISECKILLSVDDDSERLRSLHKEKQVVTEKLKAGQSHITAADNAIGRYSDHVRNATVSSLSPLLGPATELFSRMHANEVYHKLSVSGDDLNWMVLAEGHDTPLEAQEKLSQGQRQDLALSLYLARAKSTGGSFLLDEPIAHLDDLNRVAMLDIFRLAATSMPNMSLILTTASDSLARHLMQKFSSISDKQLLNTIYLEGNPRTGVKATVNGIPTDTAA
ncbi:Dna repair atpase-like protein [Pseudomonas syringae pv. syringae]|uniref:AAA family ATPase n=2 Tax=Pseudomonas syringae TaxID=317 RepID=UPI0006B95FB5|nr:AAA family ATPase [Pseudomonas syringae]KPB13128.1 Dna repair atpase-like protein [Pseudomonas syringae pv. syringae]POD19757.1 DNA repair ATPase [Pseudomonas syringae pv. syringae]UQB21697.1 AAA family ATPase [Pseudomonas syringae pv. syringae]WHN05876.1 AAA family ATPase [Pseudomonas syringae pv. syringae]